MDVTQLVEFVHTSKHLGDVIPRVLFLEHARVVQQRAEVTTWNVFHGKVDILSVLECVQETDKPWRLGRSQNVSLNEHMPNLKRK